ncbi:MAG TPA: hypothetical protein VJV39_27675 [Dongiaceae bacterium]|nr:hypothetical protein [Dongiaceae bacterium]
MRLFLLRAQGLASLISLSVLLAAFPSHADAQAASLCGEVSAAKERVIDLEIAAALEYGNSLNELALYRLMKGVDADLLPRELLDLPWFIQEDPVSDWGNADDPRTARFQQLLVSQETLQTSEIERTKFQYAQLFLREEGLRSYRPEAYTGGEPKDDWWLDEPETSPYRALDVADWLQSMAASDNLHRVYRYYSKREYRPLATSWTYFDPHALHSQAYDRITQHAIERSQGGQDMAWELVVFSRVLPSDPIADALIERFLALNERVNNCNATRSEYLSYPLLRFHTLRLLFSRGLQDNEALSRAIALMADSPAISGGADDSISDARIAQRVASLYISGRQDSWMLSMIRGAEGNSGRSATQAALANAFTERAWMIADTLATYASLTKDSDPDEREWWALNGLSIDALFKLAQSEAFTPETRLSLARVAWTRAHLLEKTKIADEIMRFLAAHDSALGGIAQPILSASGADRDRLALLLMLRDRRFSIQAEWPRGTDSRWCGHLTPDSYQDAMDDLLGRVLHYGEIPELDRWYFINYRSELEPPRSTYYGFYGSRVGYTGVLIPREWPDWLQASVDLDELRAIARLPSAPELLTRQAVAWARSDQGYFDGLLGRLWPEGDGGPGEALHRAILTTKRDCRALSHGDYSREAWILLHGNAKWKQWADKTPYWYDRFRNY